MTKDIDPNIEAARRIAMTVGDRIGGDPAGVVADLDAILRGQVSALACADETEALARIRAAYSLACKNVFDMIDVVDSAFRAIGHEMSPILRFGIASAGDIAASATEIFDAQVQEPFQPMWLVVDSAIACYFDIHRTFVGRRVQESAVAAPIPAGALARGRGIYDIARFDVMDVGVWFALEVFNRGAVPMQFRAAVFGRPPRTKAAIDDGGVLAIDRAGRHIP